MSEHTKGPWKLNGITIAGARGDAVCHLGAASQLVGSMLEQEANARLMASAPDLLEALEEVSRVLTMQEHLHPDDGWGDFISKHVTPALKKATR